MDLKKRITIEQLQEISQKQQEILRKKWKPKDGDWFYGCHSDDFDDYIPSHVNGCESCENKNHFNEGVNKWLSSAFNEELCEYILSPYCVDSGAYGASLKESPPCCYSLPLLDIGQMIEFLQNEYEDTEYKVIANCPVSVPTFNFWGSDICDALWEEVKKILKREANL